MPDDDLLRARHAKRTLKRLRKAGWRVHNPSLLIGTGGPTVYLCDAPTRRLIVVMLSSEAMPCVRAEFPKSGLSHDQVVVGLEKLVAELAQKPADDPSQRQLAAATALYLLGTHSYAITQQNPRAQYLIVRYIDASTGQPLLRPHPLLAFHELTPAQVEQAVEELLSLDRQRHPERFPRAPVVPFRLKPSN
jgi:hypothetical protein